MPASDHDAMNALIRAGRSDPVDLSDPAAINRSIRAAAGIAPRTPSLPMPPAPAAAPADFNRWADQAAENGADPAELATWTGWWVAAHRQHLADRRALR